MIQKYSTIVVTLGIVFSFLEQSISCDKKTLTLTPDYFFQDR